MATAFSYRRIWGKKIKRGEEEAKIALLPESRVHSRRVNSLPHVLAAVDAAELGASPHALRRAEEQEVPA